MSQQYPAYPGQAPQQGYQQPGQAPAGYPGQVNQGYPQQQAPQQGYQQPQKAPSTVVEVIRSNYTTISLFEVSGGYDPAQQYPKSLCFVMGVPGVKNASKQSGRSYVQANKIVMKFSTQEIRALGQSLITIATFKQASTPFIKHSDPSKNSYSQAGANQAQAKKLEAKFDAAKANIVLTMNYGGLNVLVPIPLQDAFGLGHDLINIGNFADTKLAEYKILHRIDREEVAGIDYDPAGTEDAPAYPGQAAPQQGYPGQASQPQGYAPQPQATPAPQGYPGQAPQAAYPGQAPQPQGYVPAPQATPAPQGYPGQAPAGYPQGYPGA